GGEGVFSRAQLRLLDDRGARGRIWNHRCGYQYHCHRPLPTMPGNAPRPNAFTGVAEPSDVRNGAYRGDAAFGGTDHAADRSLSGWPLLRYAGRGVGDAVDALLLDLRAPGGLRTRHSELRLYVRDYPGVFAETDLRLPGHGGSHCVHRFCEHDRVGA